MTLTVPFTDTAFPATNSAVSKNAVGSNGVVAGDLCVVAAIADKTFSSTPSLFSAGGFNNSNTDEETRWSYKQLDSGDTTISIPGDANFNGIRYAIWFIHSDTGGSPSVDVSALTQGTDLTGTNSVNTIPSPGTTTQANDLILVYTGGRASGTAWVPPAGDTIDQNNPGGYISMIAGHYTQVSAGAGSSQSATNTGAGFSRWCSGTIAIKDFIPAVPGVTGTPVAEVSHKGSHLTWSTPVSDGGAAITGYLVEKNVAAGGWTTVTTTGVVNEYSVTGLTAGVSVQFRVSAVNSVGTGTSTASNSVTPVNMQGFLLLENGSRFRLENNTSLRLEAL